MSELQGYIFEQGLKSLGVTEFEKEFLRTLGTTLAGHPEAFRACNIAFIDKRERYDYQPLIGAPLSFHFDRVNEKVQIERLSHTIDFKQRSFIRFLSLVDLAFGKIYPLGTIVELDRELLPPALVAGFEKVGLHFYASIVGRRVLLDDDTYIDYIGNMWPHGLTLDTYPLLISNLFIKRVITEGYSNDLDEYFCDEELREYYFNKNVYSSIYKGEEDEN